MNKNQKTIVLALFLTAFATSLITASDLSQREVNPFITLPTASDFTNYTIGVSSGEEYEWIVTSFSEENLELAFGSNWSDAFGLPGTAQIGHKFKVNVTSTESNGTHYLVDFAEWNCIYRTDDFSAIPNGFDRYEYPTCPQNYTDDVELARIFPLFLPTPIVEFVYDANLTATYYDASDFTSYGGGLYVYYDRQVNIGEYYIDLECTASYLQNGALEYFQFYFRNGSEYVECLKIEAVKPYHLEQTSMGCQVDEEFTWILVNYNLSVLESFCGDEFFEKYGLFPNPERMQSIKMKVGAASENETHWQVDYSLFNWTSLGDDFPVNSAQNDSYEFAKEPFDEQKREGVQIPYLIPTPTELFLRYGRLGDQYIAYYNIYKYVYLRIEKESETLHGTVCYNSAGVLTFMKFSWREQVAFELALYYDSVAPNYVGIEEKSLYEYGIYTNESIENYLVVPTKPYRKAKVEVVKIFGEEIVSGRITVVSNISFQLENGDWELEGRLNVGYIYGDNNMYFDIYLEGPFTFAPLFTNNDANWTDFTNSYNRFSGPFSSDYYTASELQNGFEIYYRSYTENVTYSYKYNETGFLSEYVIYYNGELYHNCSLRRISKPPPVIDAEPPVITVINPRLEEMCDINPFNYRIIVEEECLNSTWVTLSNGSLVLTQQIPFESGGSQVDISGQISESLWNSFSDGNITVRFWANDSSGNLNWVEVEIIKDATAPIVSILNLIPGEIFNTTAPEFALEITELHLNRTWYAINGSEKIYFAESLGSINQTMWESLPNGSVLIQFFAIDKVGNVGTAEIVVLKYVETETPPPDDSEDPASPDPELTMPLILLLTLAPFGVILVVITWRKRS